MNGSSYDYHTLALAPVLAPDPVVMPCSSIDPLLRFWHAGSGTPVLALRIRGFLGDVYQACL